MGDIYTKVPINKTAAVVVSQSGCTTELSNEQKRDNLVAKWKVLKNKILDLPKNDPKRKALGKEQRDVALQINAIRPKMKSDRDITQYIVDIIKKRMTSHQWHKLMNDAVKAKKKADKKSLTLL